MSLPDARDLAGMTLALCGIPSVTGQEADLATVVHEHLLGKPKNLHTTRYCNSIICQTTRQEGRPTIGLFGHLDTVRPAQDQPLEMRDGRVYGCGASDMKGGLAVMLALLSEPLHSQRFNLVGVFYDKEEGPASENGLEEVFQRGLIPPLDLGICLEPTDNRLQLGCVGGLHALLTFRGQRAHSARPWQGKNAIYAAIPVLSRLRDRDRVAVRQGELVYYEVANPTMASTSNSRNVIPDAFSVNVNLRFAPGKSLMQAKQELLALVDGEAEVEWVDEAPAGDVCLDHPLVQAWQARAQLPLEPKQAWTDVARLTARGIPALNFGPGETAQAHQARESIAFADLETCHRHLQQFLTAEN
ncbi:MAG: succinyl-diaminopimelate desuccinylase [Candidatus Sericytochromatia bacterium]|nr:succinyl-diaminopimelate desuccinylase [Candidatus Sericytochromatia bacterium]